MTRSLTRRLVRDALSGRLVRHGLGLRLLLGSDLLRLLAPAAARSAAALSRCSRALLVGLLRRRHRAALANELDEALGDLDDLGRLRQRNVDQRKDGAEHERRGEGLAEKLAQAAVVLAATDPWHRHDARGLGGGLALDDPLVAEILFRLPLLVEVVLEDREDVAAAAISSTTAWRRLSISATRSRKPAMRWRTRSRWSAARRRLDLVAPEQVLRAELGEFLERSVGLLEQQVLLALKRQRVELARDRLQIALQTAELIERLVDLRLQRL